MELIILNDGLYQLIPVTTEILEGIVLTDKVDCFECKENLDESDNVHNSDNANYPYNYLNYNGVVYYLCNTCYENKTKND